MQELESKIVRLEVQVETLTKEIHGVRNIIMAGSSPGHVALEEKVTNLDKRLDKLDSTIELLSEKLVESNKVPWGQWIAMVSLLFTLGGGIGSFFLSTVNANIVRLDKELTSVSSSIVPRVEHAERWRILERTDEELRRRMDALESRITGPR